MELVLATEDAAVVEGTGAAGPLSHLATPDMKSWLVITVCPISLVQFTEYTPYMKRTRVFGYTVGFMPFLIVFS